MHRRAEVRCRGSRYHRFARNLAHMGNTAGIGGRLGHGEEAAHIATKYLFLVAGLRSAQALQARGPVAGKHDKRHARGVRLHNRRVPIRHRRARSAHHAHGASGRFGQAKSKECRATLIHIEVQVEGRSQALVRLVGNHGKRGGTRTGAYHHIMDAGAHQLVEEGADVAS